MSINIPGFGSTTGVGNITGPASSTSGNFASFNGTNGQTLQDSGKSSSSFANASHTHAASDIASGTVATARLGSGTANSTTYLRGDQTWAAVTASETVQNSICNGRLTLTSGTPVLTTGVTAATTLYFTPYNGSKIALYTGSAWEYLDFSEVSLSLSGYAANTNFDIWGYNNSGTLALESTAWTNDTTRATALALQNGVYVKTGATTRRYLGTIRTTGSTGQTEFSFGGSSAGGTEAKQYLWNAQNRVTTGASVFDNTNSWTYGTASWRSANNSAGNRISFVVGLSINSVNARYSNLVAPGSGVNGAIGIGFDSTSSFSGSSAVSNAATLSTQLIALYQDIPTPGYHYLQAVEYSSGASTTYQGDAGVSYIKSGLFYDNFY